MTREEKQLKLIKCEDCRHLSIHHPKAGTFYSCRLCRRKKDNIGCYFTKDEVEICFGD